MRREEINEGKRDKTSNELRDTKLEILKFIDYDEQIMALVIRP